MVRDAELSSASVNLAVALRDILQSRSLRIVLAESCTCGNVAATLACIPGISEYLCGSFVVYRTETKSAWLGIDRELLSDCRVGPVSQEVTRLLAQSALDKTPEADISAAITGHVGPGSPANLDGTIFGACCLRKRSEIYEGSWRLDSPTPATADDYGRRKTRISEATNWLLMQILGWLSTQPHGIDSSK